MRKASKTLLIHFLLNYFIKKATKMISLYYIVSVGKIEEYDAKNTWSLMIVCWMKY